MRPKVLIFAKTNHSKTPYDQWLGDSGVLPIILTPSEFAESYSHMPEVYAFDNYDSNLLVQTKAFELARANDLIAVFARAEADIIRAAQLREVVGIAGQNSASALAYRNKIVMKDYLRGTDINLPDYRAIESAYDIVLFVEEHGFPVVIKPTSESGSLGTQIVRNAEELDQFFSQGALNNLEIERFIEGQMYHVDGFIRDGQTMFVQPSRYINNCLSFRDNLQVGSVTVPPSDSVFSSLVSHALLAVNTLPSPKNMVFHCELWLQPDGQIVFCEIASRTGGAGINSVINETFGINLDKEWFLAECKLPHSVPTYRYRAGGGVWIPPQKGILAALPATTHPSIKQIEIVGKVGQRYNGGVKSGLFLAGFVLGGETEEEVIKEIDEVVKWFACETKWESAEHELLEK